jgi:hypothetical protein
MNEGKKHEYESRTLKVEPEISPAKCKILFPLSQSGFDGEFL